MTTIIVPAGQVSAPQAVAPGVVVTATPATGGTAFVEYTLGSLADIQNGVATWSAWPKGTVSAQAAYPINKMGFVRCTAAAGAAALDMNFAPSNQQAAQFSLDWGGSLGFSGAGVGLKTPGLLAQSGVPSSVTGTTTETVLATIAIPAGIVGPNGRIRVTMGWSSAASTSHTLRARLAGTAMMTVASSSISYVLQNDIVNQNSQQSQVAIPIGVISSGATAQVTAAADMTQPQSLTITAQPGATTETVTLYWYSVEILNP